MRGLNVGCGPFKAGDDWIDTDLDPAVKPDYLCKDIWDQPEGLFDQVYLGHVLEHIDWAKVPAYVQWLWKERVAEGGRIAVVGPDVYQTIAIGEPERVRDVLEDYVHRQDGREHYNQDGLRHMWNCHQKRIEFVFEQAGIEVREVSREWLHGKGWPVTANSRGQCSLVTAAK